MDDKNRILLRLKERWVNGEISKEQYEEMKSEILSETHIESPKSDLFDARATFQGIGPRTKLKDRYEVIEELGRGGMGVVYKARDVELDTIVAVKVLPEELAQDGRAVRNLMEEAKVSMRLSHPHIMRLNHFESDERRKFLVMEYVEGETLEARLAREGKISEPELINIACQICDGLGYAHKQKVIHRDIKPSNIMISSAGETKIMDFGIARIMKDSLTMITGRLTTGTLIYMSPEQIEGRDVDGRSDLYSLGIMLYELASGTPPFYQGDITHQQLKMVPKPVDDLSPRMNEIMLKCLEKDKSQRYISADELREVIEGKREKVSENADKLACEKAQREVEEREKEQTIQVLWAEADQEWRKGDLLAALHNLRKILIIAPGLSAALKRIQEIEAEIRKRDEKKFEDAKREDVRRRKEYEDKVKLAEEKKRLEETHGAAEEQSRFESANRLENTSASKSRPNAQYIGRVSKYLEPEMIHISGGKFTMGSNSKHAYFSEKPIHDVTISDFWIGKYPITQDEWESVMGANPSFFKGDNQFPVEQVTWDDAKRFITSLNNKTGKNYRLLKEAEWEYACRAGVLTDHYGELNSIAWYRDNSQGKTHTVGNKLPNAWGLHDMLGNVWEWCEDWYDKYPTGPASNPRGPGSGALRVLRGGSWDYVARDIRVSFRIGGYSFKSDNGVGIRLARD